MSETFLKVRKLMNQPVIFNSDVPVASGHNAAFFSIKYHRNEHKQ